MMRLYRDLMVICALAVPLALGGCAGVVVVGGLAAAGAGGYAAGQERGVGTAASDFAVETDIEKAFIKTDPRLQSGLATSVYEGRVLLTGQVATPELKSLARQIASRTAGVRTVYDEIELAQPESTWDSAKDAWITAQLRSKLVVDANIRSSNYTIDTANGSVYLIGSARSQGELERATRIARYVPGVKRVVSYVEIRSGAPIAAGPPAPQPPYEGSGYAPSGGTSGAAPRTPIEVQKL